MLAPNEDLIADERSLLGMLIKNPDLLDIVSEELLPSHFLFPPHRRLYGLFVDSIEAGREPKLAEMAAALTVEGSEEVVERYTPIQYAAALAAGVDLGDTAHIRIRSLAGSIRAGSPQTPDEWRSRMGLVMWGEHLTTKRSNYEFVIEDLMPKGEPVLIIGESQSGKSFLTQHAAGCLVRGEPFFGRRIAKPMGVIWCAYEAGAGFPDRMHGYGLFHDVGEERLPFAVLTQPMHLWTDPASVETLLLEIEMIAETELAGHELGAIVIDTHNRAMSGASEVDSEVTSTIIDRYKKLMKRTGAGVWIISHKNADGHHRGNQQIYNNIETCIDVSMRTEKRDRTVVELRDADGRAIRNFKVKKQREGKSGDAWDFVLHTINVGRMDQYGKERTTCVVVPPAGRDAVERHENAPPSRDGYVMSAKQSIFFKCLIDALGKYGGLPPENLALSADVNCVVEYEHVKTLFARNDLSDVTAATDDKERAKDRDRVKKNLKAAREALMHRGVIAADDPYIWATGKRVIAPGFQWPPRSRRTAPPKDGSVDTDPVTGKPIIDDFK